MDTFAIFSTGGVGDCLPSFSFRHFIKQKYPTQSLIINHYISARSEVFTPLKHLYPTENLIQLPENSIDYFIKNKDELFNYVKNNNNESVIVTDWPDLLSRGPFVFPFEKYNTTPKLVKTHRNLFHKRSPQNKIFLALSSTTQGYMHNNTGAVIRMVAKQNPNYIIYCPIVKTWNNQKIEYGNLENLPNNVILLENPDFCECLDLMFQCKLVICLDNGFSHAAYYAGLERILLDSRYEMPLFKARWRQDPGESIPLSTSAHHIAELSSVLLNDRTLDFLPRIDVLNGIIRNADFSQELIYKF